MPPEWVISLVMRTTPDRQVERRQHQSSPLVDATWAPNPVPVGRKPIITSFSLCSLEPFGIPSPRTALFFFISPSMGWCWRRATHRGRRYRPTERSCGALLGVHPSAAEDGRGPGRRLDVGALVLVTVELELPDEPELSEPREQGCQDTRTGAARMPRGDKPGLQAAISSALCRPHAAWTTAEPPYLTGS